MTLAPIALRCTDIDEIAFYLNYGSSKAQPSKSYQVGLTLTKEEVYHRFKQQILPYIWEMAELKRKGIKALQQEPTPTACNMYSGCERVRICDLSVAQRMKGLTMVNARVAAILGKANKKEDPVNPPESKEAPPQTPATAKDAADKLEEKKEAPAAKKTRRGRPATKKTPANTVSAPSPAAKEEETAVPALDDKAAVRLAGIQTRALFTLYGLACGTNKEAADEALEVLNRDVWAK